MHGSAMHNHTLTYASSRSGIGSPSLSSTKVHQISISSSCCC